jgi:hypothetical protein
VCTPIPIDCDDGDPNTIDSCNSTTGECFHECNDRNPW